MFGVEDYNSLNREEKELLCKGFNNIFPFTGSLTFIDDDTHIKVKALELYPLSILTSLYELLEFKATGWQTFALKHAKYAVEFKSRPDGKLQISLDYPQEYLRYARLVFKLSQFNTFSMEVTHTHPNAIASLRLDSFLNLGIRASFGIPDMGAGFKSNFKIDEKSFSRYELASWWCKNPRKIVAKQIYTGICRTMIIDELAFSYYEKLSPKTHLAASARYNLYHKDYNIEVGVKHHIDEVRLLKTKIKSNGQISLTQSRIFINPSEDLNIIFQLSGSAEANLINLTSYNCRLGFRLDLKCYDL